MSTFANADDVYNRIGRMLQALACDPELRHAFRRADTCVRYELRDPDAAITVGNRGVGRPAVDLGASDQQPEVVMSMDAEVARRYLLGELDMTVALARGDMRASGPVTKILEVLPVFEPLLPRYRTLVSRVNGRGSARGDEAPRAGL